MKNVVLKVFCLVIESMLLPNKARCQSLVTDFSWDVYNPNYM